MKGIGSSKRLLFINILCLLWLPNYCDIKQNEAASNIQIPETISSDLSGIEHVSSEQEKKTSPEVVVPIEKLDVQPNVEYVNNVEIKELEVDAIDENNVKLSQLEKSQEGTDQQSVANLESSRSNNIEIKEDVSKRESPKLPEKPNFEYTTMPTVNKPELVKPSQAVSHVEPTLTKRSLSELENSVESLSPPAVPEALPVENAAKKEEILKLPHQIPVMSESVQQQPHYDGMPSFDEWKKMMLAEQQKGGHRMPSPIPPGKKISSQKRRRNYSSYECGAKIVASNAEAEGTSRILNELVDEYMLNPCKAKIWFVIELCETVQATQIELANFELFSSCPKEIAVYSSDNFPTRDWVFLGTFTAAEQRVLQSFELKQEGFGKFVKIELLSHYGKEHYCPLSVVRIFGTSMVDEYEEMETLASHTDMSEDDLDRLDISLEDKKATNIFGSATDAVMNIVKKAAQALGQQSVEDGQSNETIPDQQNVSKSKLCNLTENPEKCEDIPLTSEKNNSSTLHNFSISPSSMHKSIFRLLHRCDQCVSSRIRYYSSAQPHCRFFQAAFGPVVFQSLCDWLKEHPLVFAHESSAHSKKDSFQSDPLAPSPTKSPPPQIMIIPPENDSPIKRLIANVSHSVVSSSSTDDVINATKIISKDPDVSSTTSVDKVTLEPSIQPTHTQQTVHTVALNDTKKLFTFVESSETALPSVEAITELPRKSTVILQEDANISLDTVIAETVPIDVSVTDSSVVSEAFSDADEEQIKEFMLDPSSVTSDDITLSDIVVATDFPLKASDDKTSDMRNEMQGKLEPVAVSSVSTTGQKESVFMRMSNRIKSLELNMSLSSQYLQELSQRYRRQMEDMQRAFNRTIGTLNDTAKKAAERDLKQQDILNALQLQVSNLSQTVEILMSERSFVFRQMIETHVCLMVVEAIIMITIMSLCVRRISSSAGQVPYIQRETQVASPRITKRRSSVDSITSPVARKVKKRSASEEAINAGENLLIIEPLPVFLDPILKAKKKNRKRSRVQRSASNPSVEPSNSNSTSQSAEKHFEGKIMKNSASKQQVCRKSYACENCNPNTCTEIRTPEKDRKSNKTPFQNLTNGTVLSSQDPPAKNKKLEKGKDRFSIMRFLKFQRRDSI